MFYNRSVSVQHSLCAQRKHTLSYSYSVLVILACIACAKARCVPQHTQACIHAHYKVLTGMHSHNRDESNKLSSTGSVQLAQFGYLQPSIHVRTCAYFSLSSQALHSASTGLM
jgi:hypothetical protein